MISPQDLREYKFFRDLSEEHLKILADSAKVVKVEAGHYFFKEETELKCCYIVLEGSIAIVTEIPNFALERRHKRDDKTRQNDINEIIIDTVGPGEIFAWSALVPPHISTASARAVLDSSVIAFDCQSLLESFEDDRDFGYLMMKKAAQVVRERLRSSQIETLAKLEQSIWDEKEARDQGE